MYIYLSLLGAVLVVSMSFTYLVRRIARARNWVCGPTSKRHVHRTPVPRIGGVAVFVSFCAVALLSAFLGRAGHRMDGFSFDILIRMLRPAILVFLLGLWDDFRPVNPHMKIGIQAVAAMWLYAEGFRISHIQVMAEGHNLSSLVALPITVGWVLWVTNAFNLIDGLDGLAAGCAFISTSAMFIVSLFLGNPTAPYISIILAGSLLGFLWFNFNPATIFLGDCGSLFLGFMISAMGMATSQKASALVAICVPVLACALPVLDVALAICRRILRGQAVFCADREHIHHRLLKRGFTHRRAVLALYAISSGFACLSLLLLYRSSVIILLVSASAAAVVVIGIRVLRYDEFFELARIGWRTWREAHHHQ